MIKLIVDERDAGRIFSGLRERQRKLARGVQKFGSDFDPVLGANMAEGLEAYNRLITLIEGQIRGQSSDPRRAGRDQGEYEGRGVAPGDYRPRSG